jgi:hypothetical protein
MSLLLKLMYSCNVAVTNAYVRCGIAVTNANVQL